MKSNETPPTGNRENNLFAGSSPAILTIFPNEIEGWPHAEHLLSACRRGRNFLAALKSR
jgi:hypothetical protein